jgi:hypothetical protein
MSEPEKPKKRRLLQLHLSTALLLVILAGIFLYWDIQTIKSYSRMKLPFEMLKEDCPKLLGILSFEIIALISTTFVLEWLIRRREGGRQWGKQR